MRYRTWRLSDSFFEGLMEPNDQRCTLGYGSFADETKAFFTDFANALDTNTEQNAQHIADTISKLINTPAGQRKFRTVVDEMGMGGILKGIIISTNSLLPKYSMPLA
jgi:hypothetical protein